MLAKLKKILKSFRNQEILEQRERYYTALLSRNLPEILLFEDAEMRRVRDMINSEFALQDFSTEIHRNDIMFHYHLLQVKGDMIAALYSHFAVAARFLTALSDLLKEEQIEVSRILDFGSGYGRVSRFLPLFWPDAMISVSEVKPEAMEFQKRFGFDVIKHAQASESFDAGKFDLIMALSVFSHLPLDSFRPWLNKLLSHLLPGGILVFSFNALSGGRDADGGFRFVTNSEDLHFPHIKDANLEELVYGHAYMTEDLILSEIDPANYEVRFLGKRLTPSQETVFIRRKA